MLGMSMTFTLIEWLKDNHAPFLEQQDHLLEIKNTTSVQEMTAQVDDLTINENQEVCLVCLLSLLLSRAHFLTIVGLDGQSRFYTVPHPKLILFSYHLINVSLNASSPRPYWTL